MYNPQHARIKGNIGSMIDQGATEIEIDTYVTSEGVTSKDLGGTGQPVQPVQPAVDHTAEISKLYDTGRPVAEIEQYMTNAGYDISGKRKHIKAYADWRQSNPDYVGDVPVIELTKKKAPAPDPGYIQGTASSVLEGIIPNLANNVAGAGAVAGEGIGSLITGTEFEPGKAFDEGYANQERIKEGFAEHHGTADFAGKAAGFVGSLALPVTKIGQGANAAAHSAPAASKLGNAAINSSATGSIYGGIGGALNDSGEGRISNAIAGSVGGAALGSLVPPGLRGVGWSGSKVRQNVPGVDRVVSGIENNIGKLTGRAASDPAAVQQGQRVLSDELTNGNISTGMGSNGPVLTADTIADEMARRDLIGVPAMPADMSEQLRRVTAWSLQGRGAMTTKARQALGERQAKQGQRIRDHIQSEMGEAVDPIRAVEDIRARASAEATPNYKQAYNEGMTVSPEMQEIMKTPAFKQEASKAFKEIRDYGGDPTDFGFIQKPDGSVDFGPTPSLEAIDTIIKKIRDDIPRNPLTGRPELNSQNFRASGMASDLDREARAGSPLFDQAKSKFADEMAIRDALEQGQKVNKLSGHEIAAATRAMPEHAQEAFMTGARTNLADRAVEAGQRPTANVAQDIRNRLGLSGAGQAASPGNAVKVDAIEALSGKPGMMGRLDERLEAEDQGFKTFSEAFLNSKTAGKPQAGGDGFGALQTAGNLAQGNFVGAVASALFQSTPKGSFRFKSEVQDYIAEILTEARPQSVREAFKAIEDRAVQDNKFRALLNDAGVRMGRAGAIAFGGADGDPLE